MRAILERILQETIENLPKCRNCGSPILHSIRGLCRKCYNREHARQYNKTHREYMLQYWKKRVKNHAEYYREKSRKYTKKYIRINWKNLGKGICKKCGMVGHIAKIEQVNIKTGYRKTRYLAAHYRDGFEIKHWYEDE